MEPLCVTAFPTCWVCLNVHVCTQLGGCFLQAESTSSLQKYWHYVRHDDIIAHRMHRMEWLHKHKTFISACLYTETFILVSLEIQVSLKP